VWFEIFVIELVLNTEACTGPHITIPLNNEGKHHTQQSSSAEFCSW
jgi:hypothetical protein